MAIEHDVHRSQLQACLDVMSVDWSDLALGAGTLARLFDVERQAGDGSGHSVSEAMAAAETCPMGALEHTAVSTHV